MTRHLPLAAALALLTALLVAGDGPARANGVPQLVKLTYLDGISNFGPHEAEGVLEFSFAEAYARVEVKNLAPEQGLTYEGWMTGPGGKTLFVGDLPINASGLGSFEAKLANLDSYDYNLFLVAVRPSGTAREALPDKRSIAGRFVVLTNSESSKPGDVRPGVLPDTGESQGRTTGQRAAYALFAMAIAACCALAALRILRRGGEHD